MLFRRWHRKRRLLFILLAILLVFILFKVVSAKRQARNTLINSLIERRQSANTDSRTGSFWQKLKERFGQTGTVEVPVIAPSEVPEEFKSLYSLLDSRLTASSQKIDDSWDKSKYPVVYSAGLITANPNAGDLLLQPSTMSTTQKYLDRLAELGVKGVAIDINFPLLDPKFYSDQSKYQSYLNFYKQLFSEVEKRGMVVEVEVQPIFPNYSKLEVKPYYQSLTFDEYKFRVLEMLKTIAIELQPGFLTVANEPDTAAHNSGQPIGELNNYIGAVNYWVDGLNSAGLTKDIKLGAGFGTWYKDYKVATTRLSQLGNLDFINIHVYPIDGDLLDRAMEISDLAGQNGKKVAIHESWLYKWKIGEKSSGGIAAAGDIYGRDIFDFWSPLDQKFIGVLVKMGNYKRMEYVSFFWSNYFFNYFSFEEGSKIPSNQRMNKAMVEGAKAAVDGKITETGKFYQKLIKQ